MFVQLQNLGQLFGNTFLISPNVSLTAVCLKAVHVILLYRMFLLVIALAEFKGFVFSPSLLRNTLGQF